MKNLIFLFLLLVPFVGFAQVPSVTTSSKIKFQEGNNTWLANVSELASLITSGSGTVTSVALSPGSTGLTVSGSPITSSGTFTLTGGSLIAANGGTGQTSYAVGDLLYASTTTALSKLADVATGNALLSGGIGTAPTYGKVGLTTHVSGTLPLGNGGTGLTSVGGDGTVLASDGSANVYLSPTITTTAAAVAFARSGSNLNLNLPNADASNRGTVSTSAQTFAGAKTFNGQVIGGAGVTSTATSTAAALYATGVTGGSWVTETTTTTLDETDNFVEIGTLAGAVTISLPACNATRNGWQWTFLKTGTDTNGLTIDPAGSEAFFDSATTKTIYSAGNSAVCKCKWNGSVGTWFFQNM